VDPNAGADDQTQNGGDGSETQEPINGNEDQTLLTQSEVDSRVSQALKTSSAKLKAQFERDLAAAKESADRKALEDKEEYKTLYENERQTKERLELSKQTYDALASQKLGDLIPVFESDLSSIDGRKTAAEHMKSIIDKRVEEEVSRRLKTPAPPLDKEPARPKPITEMTPEEYKAYKKERGLY